MDVRAADEATYDRLADLAAEAATDKPLREVFKTGSWEQKRAELQARGFSDEEIEALAEDARTFISDQQIPQLGYWLW